ncbi:hypothetical protein HDU88_004076 [Geranomyces variabilis]|nr:hypothetical protein HDU88_004076 [Geranomyces variabilis]
MSVEIFRTSKTSSTHDAQDISKSTVCSVNGAVRESDAALIQDILSIYHTRDPATQANVINTHYAASATYEDPLIKVKGVRNLCAQFHSLIPLFPKIEAKAGHASNPAACPHILSPSSPSAVASKSSSPLTSTNTRTLVIPNTQVYHGPAKSWIPEETFLEVISTITISDSGKIIAHRDVWVNKSWEQPKFLKRASGATMSALLKTFKVGHPRRPKAQKA